MSGRRKSQTDTCRSHRERTQGYIEDLEAEVIRLRASLTTNNKQPPTESPGPPSSATSTSYSSAFDYVDVFTIVSSFHRQIAPGVFQYLAKAGINETIPQLGGLCMFTVTISTRLVY